MLGWWRCIGRSLTDGRNMESAAIQLREAEQFFHSRIPLTHTMGLRVVGSDDDSFIVEAPVALNSNHLETAFGGSINAVATLAGYGLLWLELREAAASIVIRESSIRFLHPIRQTIRAICERPTPEELGAFRRALQTRGKARIVLHVRCEENSRVAADFKGTFVAITG